MRVCFKMPKNVSKCPITRDVISRVCIKMPKNVSKCPITASSPILECQFSQSLVSLTFVLLCVYVMDHFVKRNAAPTVSNSKYF